VLVGGVEAWLADGGALSAYPLVRAADVAPELASGTAHASTFLDVRDPREWRDEGHVPGAPLIPVGELPGRLDELPRDAPVTVFCKSGSRSSIAASVLDAAGFEVRLVGRGGAADLVRTPVP
jgi:rhodanese-related sulfurtransferase